MSRLEIDNILHRVANGTTTELDAQVLAEALDTSRKMDFWSWIIAGVGTAIVLVAMMMGVM